MEATTIIPQFKASIECEIGLSAMVRHEDTLGQVTFIRQPVTLQMIDQALRAIGYTVVPVEPIVEVKWGNWRSDGKVYHAQYEGYELTMWEDDDEWNWEVKDVTETKLSGKPRFTFATALQDAGKALSKRLSAPDWLTDEDIIDEDERVTTVDK